LNEDEFLKADGKRKGTLVKNVCRAIDGYTRLCKSLDNSVFFPKFNTNEFLQKLENNAFRKYNEEIEQLLGDGSYSYRDYRNKLQEIIKDYQIEDGSHQGDWRQSFNNQFDILNIPYIETKLINNPENNIRKTYGENFIRALSSIALLNKFIYDKLDRHLFVYHGLYEELIIKSHFKDISVGKYLGEGIKKLKNDELNKIIKESNEFEGVVKKKSIEGIKETALIFKTLEEAVKKARDDFRGNLVFGNDIDRGVKERNKDAGRPPDKVYYYLQTLSEVTEIKRTARPDCSLLLLARMYGCNCSDQSEKIMYDDGSRKNDFSNHLKPAESKIPYYIDKFDDGHCIRIFFKWSEETKKTIVGWIGKHPD
jgi:hypothetical protein